MLSVVRQALGVENPPAGREPTPREREEARQMRHLRERLEYVAGQLRLIERRKEGRTGLQ